MIILLFCKIISNSLTHEMVFDTLHALSNFTFSKMISNSLIFEMVFDTLHACSKNGFESVAHVKLLNYQHYKEKKWVLAHEPNRCFPRDYSKPHLNQT